MATAIDYVVGALSYAAWMVGYGVLTTLGNFVIPLAKEMDETGMFAEPIGWWEAALGHWILVFFLGMVVSLLAAAVASRGGL